MQRYDSRIFDPLYVHLSSNSYELELFCFKRWFILNTFLQERGVLGPFLLVDSDVMLYSDFSRLLPELQEYDMTISNGLGPEYAYFRDRTVLAALCSFIIESYSKKENIADLERELREYQASSTYCGGGICDMRIIRRFIHQKGIKTRDLALSGTSAGFFDDNINETHGFVRSRFGTKEITWIDGVPHRITDTGSVERVAALHFQGSASKRLVRTFYTGSYSADLVARIAGEILLQGWKALSGAFISAAKGIIGNFPAVQRLARLVRRALRWGGTE